MISPHKLFQKIALKQHGSIAVRFEERSFYERYQLVSSNASILFVVPAHSMEYSLSR
jgi:hypothetical protein